MSETVSIKVLLAGMAKNGASDLHLKVGLSPYYRVAGKLRRIASVEPFTTNDQIESVLEPIIPADRRAAYDQTGNLDFSYQGASGDRYRVNVFRATGEMHAAIRRVQSRIDRKSVV